MIALEDIREDIERILERSFTHQDYLRLRRKWKLFSIKQVASELTTMVDIIRTEESEHWKEKAGYYQPHRTGEITAKADRGSAR